VARLLEAVDHQGRRGRADPQAPGHPPGQLARAGEHGFDALPVAAQLQVVVSRWSSGRVALVGDAAWGSGPTGMGTTLSLVGAHVLAGELGRTLTEPGVTPGTAFARYERLLRRYVDRAQGLPPGTPGVTHPRSERGVRLLHRGMRVALAPSLRRFSETTLVTSQRHVPTLPEYPRLRG